MTGRITVPVIGIVGWKNSGKTTLATRLIAELTARGMAVASIKRTHHAFQVDEGDTDSARHRRAGARQVALVADGRWALMSEVATPHPMTLEAMLAKLDTADIVVVEGFKSASIPKIEVRGVPRDAAPPLAPDDDHVIAVACDGVPAQGDPQALPRFSRDAVGEIATFVAAQCITAA